jgi:phospholipid/cholesterol/gamma-HCH transport system substrate-binding protein
MLGQSGDVITNIIEVTTTLKSVLQSIDRGEGLLGELVKSRPDGSAIVSDIRKAVVNIEHSTASASRIIERVEHGEGAVGALLKDSQQMERILKRLEASSASLEQFTQRLQKGDGALPRLLDDDAYAREVLGDVQRAAANLAAISDKVNRGEGTLGAMVNDPTLYQRASSFLGGGTGWAVAVFRGVRGLWPFGSGSKEKAGADGRDAQAPVVLVPADVASPIPTPVDRPAPAKRR